MQMRCHYRTFNTRNIRETILTALHLVHTFHLFSRYVFTLLTKMWTGTKTVPSTWYIFNVEGCSHTDFHICALYCYWLTWRIGEFLREKRSVAFLTGHLFTFLVVLILICLVTTQILICENQTTWRLEILLRTIVAALLKTKCNGRFVINKRYQKAGKEYFRRVQMIVKDEGYKYFPARATFDAWSCPPSPPSVPQTRHTHTPTKRALSAWWPLPIPPPAHTTLFPISITTDAQVFLSHNCPKRKENLFHKSWKFA